MKLYNIHLKFSDDSETQAAEAARSLPDLLTQLSDYELTNLNDVELITEYEGYTSCLTDLSGEVNMFLVEIVNLANAADLYRDSVLTYDLSETEHDKRVSEELSVILDVIESKVKKTKEYLDIMDAVIRRRVDIPKNERPPLNTAQ